MPRLKNQVDQSFQLDFKSEQKIQGNYSIITFQDRIKLIQMVCLQNMKIIQAADTLGIGISTAKYILSSFRKKGRILRKCEEMKIDQCQISDFLQELKQKVQESNLRKSEKKDKKKENKVNKNQSNNLKKNETSNQLIMNQHQHEKQKLIPESKISETGTHDQNEQNGINNSMIYCVMYYPVWMIYQPQQEQI